MGPAFGGTHTLIQDGFVCHHVFISPDRTPTLSPHSAFFWNNNTNCIPHLWWISHFNYWYVVQHANVTVIRGYPLP